MNKEIFPASNLILSSQKSLLIDRKIIASGVMGKELMERAGRGVADNIQERWSPRPTLVLCGPGNNGGDGFVVARFLSEAGWPVRLGLLGSVSKLKVDAKLNAERLPVSITALEDLEITNTGLVIDALFGVGLSRPIQGLVAQKLEQLCDIPCIAVDIPSGIDSDTGASLGYALKADLTVTFTRLKPGHLLFPGRSYCGETVVVDIGIPNEILNDLEEQQAINSPRLWRDIFPWPRAGHNKYERGSAMVFGGEDLTGASRMAVLSAQRVGAGLVSLVTNTQSALVYQLTLTSAIVRILSDNNSFRKMIEDSRVKAWLIGPGSGTTAEVREHVLSGLLTGIPAILDADVFSVFQNDQKKLFEAISGPCVMTPHEDEFKKFFNFDGDKLARVREAARCSNSIVLLKGADTVIAHPDGRVVVNANAPPNLATAGSGDVLAGLITGLIAQGMTPFMSACAATWLHGEAARKFGYGLIAEDLISVLPDVLNEFKDNCASDLALVYNVPSIES